MSETAETPQPVESVESVDAAAALPVPHRLVNGRVVPLTPEEIAARAAEEAAVLARP